MPVEVILPSAATILVFMVMASALMGLLVYSTTLLYAALRDHVDSLAKAKLNRVVITSATALVSAGNNSYLVEFEVHVYNDGVDPIYAMDKCDLIVQYYTTNGELRVLRLIYGLNWTLEKVIITSDYAVLKPSIGPSETGVIRGTFTAENIDINRPLKAVFTSHYGYTAMRWFSIGS